ncbi:hypothetical protein BDY21DRAFT_279575 [Lineolata rhizophorae]|uniref:BZIP domain-containing protein n=1 Tax=Lineolata rhizophorae TaxID=578093 RepID=A0A6A6PC40_9PEZI|nr:hypothetical protein BDY21DRAFT_279575 [Lineolata rhizophorae]
MAPEAGTPTPDTGFSPAARPLTQAGFLNIDDDLGAGAGAAAAFGAQDLTFDDATLFSSAASFNPINSSSVPSSTQTVSPKDIFNEGFGSAPPSTAFTHLTSPSIDDSPFGGDSYDCSPAFQTDGVPDATNTTSWYSLFPDAGNDNSDAAAVDLERSASGFSLGQASSSGQEGSPLVTDNSHRRTSSLANASPITDGRPHSASNGVKANRRRKGAGELPPIQYDKHDKVAAKRARNTLAARESRKRKLEHLTELQERISQLESENAQLRDSAGRWKALATSHGLSLP